MSRQPHDRPTPTDAEMAILRVLWDCGPCTVRQVHQVVGERGVGYTTTLKIMQIMAEKGLVLRDETNRSHVYEAAVEQAPTQRRLLGEFMDRAFGGSAGKLVLQAISAGDLSPQERKEIHKLLREKGASDGKSR